MRGKSSVIKLLNYWSHGSGERQKKRDIINHRHADVALVSMESPFSSVF